MNGGRVKQERVIIPIAKRTPCPGHPMSAQPGTGTWRCARADGAGGEA